MDSPHVELLERHKKVMPSWLGLYYEEPIELVGGDGCHVWDGQGKEYLDFFGGILTTSTGYNVPEVVEAVQRQAEQIMHTSTLYLIRPMIELAEKIAELSTIPDAKVFFVNSGTEAIETALMLACSARNSNQVLALRHSYHGRSFAAMSVTGNRSWSASSLSPLAVSYVQNGRGKYFSNRFASDTEVIEQCVDDLREVIETTTAGDIACMIAEPIQGVGGFILLPDGLLRAYKEVLDGYGIYLISDEVQTGWGRTGTHFWGFQSHNVVPDMFVFAKGIGNGLAIGGVVGRGDIIDSLAANSISTFGGNPLATTGALANLKYILDHDLQANSLKVGSYILDELRQRTENLGIVREIRGKGLMVGVELVSSSTGLPNPVAAQSALEECKKLGVLIGKGGLYGNCLRIAPPMTVTIDEAYVAINSIADALQIVEDAESYNTRTSTPYLK